MIESGKNLKNKKMIEELKTDDSNKENQTKTN